MPSKSSPYYYGSCVVGTNAFTNAVWSYVGAGPWSQVTDAVSSGSLMVVTDGTSAWTSTNGASWSGGGPIVTGRSSMSYSLAYNGVNFLAFSSSVSPALFATSTNGVTWASYTVSLTNVGYVLSAVNGLYIISPTSAGTYYVSSDNGLTWTGQTLNPYPNSNDAYTNFAYGGGVYAAMSTSFTSALLRGTSLSAISYSSSLSNGCSPCSAGLSTAGMAYGANQFMTVNKGGTFAYTSATATTTGTWAMNSVPFTTAGVYFVYDRFFITGWSDYTVTAISSTGTVWYPNLLPAQNQGSFLSIRIVYCSGKFYQFKSNSAAYSSMPTS